jgi:hypothetical protein
MLSEMKVVQTAQILWGDIVGIRGLQACIHFKLLIPGKVLRNDAADADSVETAKERSKRRFRSFNKRNSLFPTRMFSGRRYSGRKV